MTDAQLSLLRRMTTQAIEADLDMALGANVVKGLLDEIDQLKDNYIKTMRVMGELRKDNEQMRRANEGDKPNCPSCHISLIGTRLYPFGDLHYNSQGVTSVSCPSCGVSLRIDEHEHTFCGVSSFTYFIHEEPTP